MEKLLNWFKQLYLLLLRETSNLTPNNNYYLGQLSMAFSEWDSPLKMEYLKGDIRNSYIEACITAMPNSPSLNIFLMKEKSFDFKNITVPTTIESNRLKKYQSYAHIEHGQVLEAIKELTVLKASDDLLLSFDAAKMLVEAYISINKHAEAIETFVDTVLKNNNLIIKFDTEAICSSVKAIVTQSSSISLPIAVSFHSRYVDDTNDALLKYSFELYLKNNKVKNPIDII